MESCNKKLRLSFLLHISSYEWLLLTIFLFLTSLLFSQSRGTKSFSNLENEIIDTISKLKPVIERMHYVDAESKGKRQLKFIIWRKPTKSSPFFWVKVMEDNGISYYTHFNFYVYPKTMKINFYDTFNNKTLDLDKWGEGKQIKKRT